MVSEINAEVLLVSVKVKVATPSAFVIAFTAIERTLRPVDVAEIVWFAYARPKLSTAETATVTVAPGMVEIDEGVTVNEEPAAVVNDLTSTGGTSTKAGVASHTSTEYKACAVAVDELVTDVEPRSDDVIADAGSNASEVPVNPVT